MIQQQETLAAAGASTTVGTGFIGVITEQAIPLLSAASLTVSVLVGVATLVWYIFKFVDRAKAKREGK